MAARVFFAAKESSLTGDPGRISGKPLQGPAATILALGQGCKLANMFRKGMGAKGQVSPVRARALSLIATRKLDMIAIHGGSGSKGRDARLKLAAMPQT